jgi:hypothetical protein|nr:hypothetical protein [uncultured Halomonas sp.]
MLKDTPPNTFNESDLTNIQNFELIQENKNKLKKDICNIEMKRLSAISVSYIQGISTDIMKMSDEDILSLIEKIR